MATKQTKAEEKQGVSGLQLAMGAASLFLFIVGLKRTFRVEETAGNGARPAGSDAKSDGRARSGQTR